MRRISQRLGKMLAMLEAVVVGKLTLQPTRSHDGFGLPLQE